MRNTEASNLDTLFALTTSQPVLRLHEGDIWTLQIEGLDEIVSVVSKRGNKRSFKDPMTAIKLLREAGYTGRLHIEV